MSYENNSCPCGNKKPTDTLLCDDCFSCFSGRKEMAIFAGKAGPEIRRNAAIILLMLSRRRKLIGGKNGNARQAQK